MMNFIFFLPNAIRAYLYCRLESFQNFIEKDGLWNNHHISEERWEFKENRNYEVKKPEETAFILKKLLDVPSFLLIRKNSDTEKLFLRYECRFYNHLESKKAEELKRKNASS